MAIGRLDVELRGGNWNGVHTVPRKTYVCRFCGDKVGSGVGFGANLPGQPGEQFLIRICPSCDGPTLFTPSGKRCPGESPGEPVAKVPDDVDKLYNEARISTAAGAFTAAVLVCRKILMHIAVEQAASEGNSFVSYVEYLASKGYVPPDGKGWVDYIRKRGNEANHEIALMEEEDAKALITFVEMLLRFIYEFPSLVPPEPKSNA